MSKKSKTLVDNLIGIAPYSEAHGALFNLRDLEEELQRLKSDMIAEGRPGANLIIKKMEACDYALNQLYEALNNSTTRSYRSRYVNDVITRRYIFVKYVFNSWYLKYMMDKMRICVGEFNLTPENTMLPPTYRSLHEARLWRQNHLREQARHLRRERTAQKRVTSGGRAKDSTMGSYSGSAPKSKVSTGS